MGQLDLFDDAESRRRKKDGMEAAAGSNPELETARLVAVKIAESKPDRTTHADEVGQAIWEEYGMSTLGPSAGSLFAGSQWEFTGKRVLSTRKRNHSREIKVWRLT